MALVTTSLTSSSAVSVTGGGTCASVQMLCTTLLAACADSATESRVAERDICCQTWLTRWTPFVGCRGRVVRSYVTVLEVCPDSPSRNPNARDGDDRDTVCGTAGRVRPRETA